MRKTGQVFFISVLILFSLSGCKKGKKDTPDPEPAPTTAPVVHQSSTLTEQSMYLSYANFLVSDIEMICSFIGEDDYNPLFYKAHSSSNGTITTIRDLFAKRVFITFNNTLCNDGRFRDGSIFMFYGEPMYLQYPQTGNENYVRDYNFTGRIVLEEYRVDGWKIEDKDFSVFIKNLRPNAITPIAGNLQWSFEGDFTITKGQESMLWKGKYIKTLENTSNPSVFNPNTQSRITWSLAAISYTGNANGTTKDNVTYSLNIQPDQPLKRELLCSPDAISSNTSIPFYPGFHPFTSGVISYTQGTSTSVKKIFYSNLYNTEPHQCDNIAILRINNSNITFTLMK